MSLEKLESKRLFYRPFEERDFEDLYEILGSEEVCRFLPVKPSYTKEQVERVLMYFIKTFLIEKKNLHYAVVLKDTNEFIGYCGCSYIKEYDCNEIEYFLKPKYYGHKYASEMAFQMKEVAVLLGLKDLVGLADINNIPSQKILEKIGYEYVEDVSHWGADLRLYKISL